MLAELRRLRIAEYVRQHESGVVTVAELSQLLAVSDMTIRRDLALLERQSFLRRVHGGAVAYQQSNGDKSFLYRTPRADPQKQIIGWLAAQLVNDGDRIILDAGTTTLQVANNLTCKNQLTVITNNIPVANELAQCSNIVIILLGGIVKHNECCTVGNMVSQSLSLLSADKYFLSATHFSLRMGAMETDMAETEVKQAMLRSASQTILLADSTKFDVSCPHSGGASAADPQDRLRRWLAARGDAGDRSRRSGSHHPQPAALRRGARAYPAPAGLHHPVEGAGIERRHGNGDLHLDRYLLGLDAGTTSVKAALFDSLGKCLGIGREEYQLSTPSAEQAELDAEIYWQASLKAMRAALATAGVAPGKVRAISVSSQGETTITLDAHGSPLRPALVWLDNRSVPQAEWLAAQFDSQTVYETTGVPEIVPTWTACKILWIRENEPEIFAGRGSSCWSRITWFTALLESTPPKAPLPAPHCSTTFAATTGGPRCWTRWALPPTSCPPSQLRAGLPVIFRRRRPKRWACGGKPW